MDKKDELTNGSKQLYTSTACSTIHTHVITKKSAPPRKAPITPFVKKALSYRGMKSYSQAEIILSADSTPRHSLSKNIIPSASSMIDADIPADEFESPTSTVPISETASVRSDDEDNSEDEEEEKQSLALPVSRIGSVGERGFSKEIQNIIHDGVDRTQQTSSPSKVLITKRSPLELGPLAEEERKRLEVLESKAKETAEESKQALKVSKAPDPFEDKYSKAEVQQLNELISNTSSQDNPLYYLRLGGTQSRSLQRSYRNFVVSLFESIFLVKDVLGPAASAKVARKLNLRRSAKLKSISDLTQLI